MVFPSSSLITLLIIVSDLLVSSCRVLPLENNSSVTKYCINGNSISISYPFEKQNILAVLKPHGGNGLFDFSYFGLIDENQYPDITKTTAILPVSTDWHAPYIVSATEGIDGDDVSNHYFTGGNHQYNNRSSGSTATARCSDIRFFIDGVQRKAGCSFANIIEIRWTNYVQAYNTRKTDGSGREVLKENHRLVFNGSSFSEECIIIPLENIYVEKYYGIQVSGHSTIFPRIIYKNTPNIINTGESFSGDNHTSAFVAYGDKYKILCEIDDAYGIGDFGYYDGNRSAFSTSSKCYFYLIKNHLVNYGDTLAFKGSWELMPSSRNTYLEEIVE